MIEQGDVEVTYLPKKEMWSVVLTKPKQGNVLCEDRVVFMNIPVDYEVSKYWEDIDMIAGFTNP